MSAPAAPAASPWSEGPLRIAQIAPLHESVPPRLYGGTERVVSYLTEELVRAGHDVTLFASGDSRTEARLVPAWDAALRLSDGCRDANAAHLVLLETVFRRAGDFDVLHFHLDHLHLPFLRRHPVPHVTTLHGRLDSPELNPLFREYPDSPVVSISDAQRGPLPWLNWRATVQHGLPIDLYRPTLEPGEYLAFLGRVSPEKGLDRAIRIAEACRVPLRVAAKIDPADREYFGAVIRPLLDSEWVEFVGEIGESEKGDFLGGARALLFPIDWPEPFGLVLIEALACGTPAIAFRRGSVAEIVTHGVTGFVVDDETEAIEAVRALPRIRRRRCRHAFETRFLASRMASDYLSVYARSQAAAPVAALAG